MTDSSVQPFDGAPPTRDHTRAQARSTLGDDNSLFEMLMPHFCEAATTQAASVIAAAQAQDAEQLRHWAHTLKGTLLTIGAAPSAALAARIELDARNAQLQGTTELATRLATEVAHLVAQLRPA